MGKSKDLATGAAYQDQTESDTRYANVSGDTFTGNVGIGGAPNKEFHVRDDNSFGNGSRIVAALSPSITNGQDAGLAFGTYSPDDYWKQGIFWERTGSYGLGHLHFANRGTADATTVSKSDAKMTINANGSVTTPNQTSFYAYTSSDYTATGALTGGNKWGERWDIGNNFSDGTFTAPVAGKYYFEVMWDANSIRSTIDLQVNTTGVIRFEPTGRTDDTWETHFYSGLVNLAANDSVRLYGNMHSASSNYPFHMGSGVWGHFAGFLIG